MRGNNPEKDLNGMLWRHEYQPQGDKFNKLSLKRNT